MVDTISAVVKAVRLRYAVPVVLLLVVVYWQGIRPWMADWGSTEAERAMSLPGDELFPDSTGNSTLAVTIRAPSDVVWQWLVQIGQDRAGFYTYTWLENLIGVDIHNADEIHPEWQELAVGDQWRLGPPEYLWGLGKELTKPVLISQPGEALVVEMFGAHVIKPIDDRATRLLVRGQKGPASLATMLIADPLVFTMERRMLLGLKARAEGRPDAASPLMTIARIGWAAAGIAITGLFLVHRRRRYWLALPVLAALPALLMAGDLQAGGAAFTAVGVSILGFLVFGRDWWGTFLIVGSVVMLTLLLASEAYTAIGVTFALTLLAVAGALIIARSRTPGRAPRRLAARPR